MARQRGIIKIDGTLDDITFYKSADGYIVKQKSAVSKEKILNDAAFERTRENMQEFGRAGKASRLLRLAIRELLQAAKDRRVTSRLTKDMMRVIKADATSTRGLRNVIDGEAELLKNFNFNIQAIWSATVYAPYTVTMDRVSGVHTVDIPAYVPRQMVVWPEGATHYKLVSAAADIDFGNETQQTVLFETAYLPLANVPTTDLTITHTLSANSTNPLFVFIGIQFYQEVNGVQCKLKNSAFNSLNIVEVSGV